MRKVKKISSPTKKKILLMLKAGIALGLSPSPKMHFRILKEFAKEWRDIDRQYLYRAIREFKYDRLIEWEEKPDGSIRVVLSELGKKRILEYDFEQMKIKIPAVWDKKWRVVLFDIPEKKRRARDALRNKLKDLGFLEMQKSVFIFPYECRNEIDFVVEFF